MPEGTRTAQVEEDKAMEFHTADSASIKLQVEDTGSVASDTKTLMRHLRILRNALYENYSP